MRCGGPLNETCPLSNNNWRSWWTNSVEASEAGCHGRIGVFPFVAYVRRLTHADSEVVSPFPTRNPPIRNTRATGDLRMRSFGVPLSLTIDAYIKLDVGRERGEGGGGATVPQAGRMTCCADGVVLWCGVKRGGPCPPAQGQESRKARQHPRWRYTTRCSVIQWPRPDSW